MKAKDFKSVLPLFAKTYGRKMFGFISYGELKLLPKKELVKQTKPRVSMGSHVDNFLKEKKLRLVVNNVN